jgi:hypothetical protein
MVVANVLCILRTWRNVAKQQPLNNTAFSSGGQKRRFKFNYIFTLFHVISRLIPDIHRYFLISLMLVEHAASVMAISTHNYVVCPACTRFHTSTSVNVV